MKVTIFLEGGGDRRSDSECRRAFSKLFDRAGLQRPNAPTVIACGSRNEAYKRFCDQFSSPADRSLLLLVDSETQVQSTKWDHVSRRDGDNWTPPPGATENHLWFMMQCMQTWIVADRQTLLEVFGSGLISSALPPLVDLENRSKDDIQRQLNQATAQCDRDRKYEKGRRSYHIVEKLKIEPLKANLPHFKSLIDHLRGLLS